MVLLTGTLGMRGDECLLTTELNQLLTSTRGGWLTWDTGDPSVWVGLWTLDIECLSVRGSVLAGS